MKDKIYFYAAFTVTACGAVLAAYFFFRYLFSVFCPFFIGWGIAMLLRQPAAVLGDRLGVRHGPCRLALAFLCLAGLGTALFFGIRGLLYELTVLLSRIETGGWDFGLYAEEIRRKIPFFGNLLPPAEEWFPGLIKMLLRALPGAVSALAGFLPSFFLSLMVSLTAALYFCLDLDRVHAALLQKAPRLLRNFGQRGRKSAVSAAFTVLRANLILMLIAFAIMLPGFVLFGVRYPLLLSITFSLLDLLPVIGAGAFLLPLSVCFFLLGNTFQGFGVLLIFLAVAIVRQCIEPHLLGARAGLHPLLGLLAMYAGERLFGFVGLLTFPLLTLFFYGILFPQEGGKKKKRRAGTNGTPTEKP